VNKPKTTIKAIAIILVFFIVNAPSNFKLTSNSYEKLPTVMPIWLICPANLMGILIKTRLTGDYGFILSEVYDIMKLL
jgi:hypothetical protein